MSTFLRDPPHPSRKWDFQPYRKIADFLDNKTFFSDSPNGFALFLGLWGACLAHLSMRKTFFSLWVCPKMCFFPLHIPHSLYFSTKGIFFWWSQRIWMHFWPLCMQLRPPISFFLLFGTNSSPERVTHFLVSPKSIRIAPNWLFFGAPTWSEVLLCWSRRNKISTFLRDPPSMQFWMHPTPLKTEIFTLLTKSQTFYRINVFFS